MRRLAHIAPLLLLPWASACEGVLIDSSSPPVSGDPPRDDGGAPFDASGPGNGSDASADTAPPGDNTDDGSQDDDDGSGGGTAPADGVVPDTAHCEPVSRFGAEVTAHEDEVLRLVNQHRAAGADCGTGGTFQPTHALVMDPHLRCAARLHSLDMYERNYFDHESPEGESPADRMEAAGYGPWRTWGENIIERGSGDPADMVAGWMASDGHCANIMSHGFTEIGVGIVSVLGTQKFADPW